MAWDIVRLTKAHDGSAFSCGVPSLDEFLQRYVTQYEKRNLGRTFVLVRDGGPQVLGYFTLAVGHITKADLPEEEAKKLPKHPIPIALLGRLAADQSVRGQGLGADLLAEALSIAVGMSERAGVFAVCVDAIDDAGSKFYQKHGFTPLQDQPNRLFLPIGAIPSDTGTP